MHLVCWFICMEIWLLDVLDLKHKSICSIVPAPYQMTQILSTFCSSKKIIYVHIKIIWVFISLLRWVLFINIEISSLLLHIGIFVVVEIRNFTVYNSTCWLLQAHTSDWCCVTVLSWCTAHRCIAVPRWQAWFELSHICHNSSLQDGTDVLVWPLSGICWLC